MSIEADLFTALAPLVSSRVYPLRFPDGGHPDTPTWPAIRYTLGAVPDTDLCGSDAASTADVSVQIDTVAATYAQLRSLRLSLLAALAAFTPPAVVEAERETFDAETNTYRLITSLTVYPSST